MGTNQTLSSLASKYWILVAREAIIKWKWEFLACKRQSLGILCKNGALTAE